MHSATLYPRGVNVLRKNIKSQSNVKMKVTLLSLVAKFILCNPEYKGTNAKQWADFSTEAKDTKLLKSKTLTEKGTCTPMLTVALITTAKAGRPPERPQTGEQVRRRDEWIEKGEWSVTQSCKAWNDAICSNMDGPRDHHIKWTNKDKCHMISLTRGI